MKDLFQCRYRTIGKDVLQNVRHSHNETETLFVENGSGSFTIGERIYPLSSRGLYFINANTLHFTAPTLPKKYVRSIICISKEYFSLLCESTGYGEIANKLQKQCYVLLDSDGAMQVDRAMKQMQNREKRICVRALLDVLEIADQSECETVILDNKATKIMEYINQNISEDLSLDKIAARMFIGKYYMCHLFKMTTGMSITQYILLQRLSLCKNLLLSTDKSVSEIAMLCGFSAFSYFCRAFAKNEGMSASAFRKKFAQKSITDDENQ